jgi:anti-sigma B factor antagonist
MDTLRFEIQDLPGHTLATVAGNAGVAGVADLDRGLMRLSAARPKLVVFDLSELAFISSLGLGSLVAFQRGLQRAGGRAALTRLQPAVSEMLKHARLDTVFQVYDTVEEATRV